MLAALAFGGEAFAAVEAARRAFPERHRDTATLVMTAHFPSPSVGFVRARREAFDRVYDE